ncbi:hypothetical protein AB0F45_37260 [Streptomyces achromogenes]|uniref:hypothetical protein n=1 Tax=Streptomyces achromogenes TaxID=67255 RepID=UPI0033E4E1B6
MLRSQISGRDLDQLVFTDRYRMLLGSCGTLAGTDQQRRVNGLVQLEVAERIEAFEAAVAALDTQIRRWSQREVFLDAGSAVALTPLVLRVGRRDRDAFGIDVLGKNPVSRLSRTARRPVPAYV